VHYNVNELYFLLWRWTLCRYRCQHWRCFCLELTVV